MPKQRGYKLLNLHRKIMNRILLLVCASLCAVSCNRSTDKRIVFIPKGRAHVFWQSVHAGAIAAMRENPGYTVIWNGPASETDFEGEIKIVDAAINQHVDAICLAPIDKKVLVAVVERAAAQGIPVVIFDSPIDTDKFVAQVATDNYVGGATGSGANRRDSAGQGKDCRGGGAAGQRIDHGARAGVRGETGERFAGDQARG